MGAPDFEDVVAEFYPLLYRFGLALTRSEADAADLTQQTFYLWATKGHQLHNQTKVKSWLCTSLYREFLHQKRRASRFAENEELSESASGDPETATCAVDKLDGEIVLEALYQLEDNFRAPLSLFYLEQHSYGEIAEILDVPIGTIMSRISRGKTKLRKLLSSAVETDTDRRSNNAPKSAASVAVLSLIMQIASSMATCG